MLTALLVILCVTALAMPGVLLIGRLAPERPAIWRYVQGSILGWALSVCLAYLCVLVDLRLFFPAFAAMFVAVFLWRKSPSVCCNLERSPETTWLLTLLGIVALSRIGVAIIHDLPPGWDPSFHMIFCRKLMLTNHLFYDWMPFEAVDVNYPLGSHLLIAVMAKAMSLPPHAVFNVLLPLTGVLMTAAVYVLAASAGGNRRIALLAAAGYGLWAALGSIEYYRWGGLPNAMGMLFLLAVLQLLIEPPFRGKQLILCILCSAIILTHHHVMLTAIALFAAFLLASCIWRDRSLSRQLLLMAAGSFLLTSFYCIPYLLKIAQLSSTTVLRYEEEAPLWRYPASIGYLFFACAVLGVAQAIHSRKSGPIRNGRVIALACGVLLVLYLLCAQVYPLFAMRWYGKPYVAFTPSRFVTDLAPLASIFVGLFLWIVSRKIPLGVVMLLVVLAGAAQWATWGELLKPTGNAGYIRACEWIGRETPAGTLVLTDVSWVPYLSWRRTLCTPIPVSEGGRQPATMPGRRALAKAILRGEVPEDAAMPMVAIVKAPSDNEAILWQDAQTSWAVIRVRPGTSLPTE